MFFTLEILFLIFILVSYSTDGFATALGVGEYYYIIKCNVAGNYSLQIYVANNTYQPSTMTVCLFFVGSPEPRLSLVRKL